MSVILLKSGGTDTSEVTATAADVVKGKIIVDQEGDYIEGTLPLDEVTTIPSSVKVGGKFLLPTGELTTGTMKEYDGTYGVKPAELNYIFGDGHDGSGNLNSDEIWYTPNVDTGVIEKQFRNLNIPKNVTIKAGNRNSGMIIRVQGDCIIEGTLENRMAPKSHTEDLSEFYPSWMLNNGFGGDGEAGENSTGKYEEQSGTYVVYGGKGQKGRRYGGGYSGGGAGAPVFLSTSGLSMRSRGGDGGSAENISIKTGLFVGGPAAEIGGTGNYAYNNGQYGGGGSGCSFQHIVSGAGGSGASKDGGNGTWDGSNRQSGAGGGSGAIGGGVIILYVRGKIIINGTLNCQGNKGGSGGLSFWSPGAGGNSGGGRIYILAAGEMDLASGKFNVDGGTPTNESARGTRYYINFEDYEDGAGAPTQF